MSKIGTADIKGIMLGSTEISKAYLGSDIVYQNAIPAPEGYEWASYVANPSTAHINTGVAENTILRVECEMRLDTLRTSGGNYLFSGRNIEVNVLTSGRHRACWVNYKYNTFSNWGIRMQILIRKGYAKLDTVALRLTSADVATTDEMKIFSSTAQSANSRKAVATCWWFKIFGTDSGNEVLLRNYVPIKRKSDGVYGLWDKVNETFNPSATAVALTGG